MHLVTQNSITNNDKICKKKGFCQTKKILTKVVHFSDVKSILKKRNNNVSLKSLKDVGGGRNS
jgi:hypothetical protein